MKRSLSVLLCASALVIAGCGDDSKDGGGSGGTGGATGGAGGRGGSSGTGGSTAGSGGSTAGSGGSTGGTSGSGGSTAGSGGSTGGASGSGGSTAGSGGSTGGASGSGGSAGSGGRDGGMDTAGSETSTGADGGSASPGQFPVPPGMTNLFDGTSLMGWAGNMSVWKLNAEEKAIHGITPESNGGTFFYTDGDYDDFRLVLTEKAVATMNHMGICFWGRRGGTGSNGCIDIIPPSGSIWDYGGGGQKPGGVGSANNPIKFMWHQVEILATAATGEILVAVNGKQTTTFKQAGRAKKGPIGLQAHAKASNQMYKDIWVEANPKERRLLTVK